MICLCLDTTTRSGSVAVLDGDTTLALIEGDATRTHGERLPAGFEDVLERAGVRLTDVGLLAVARGPGAFTGLRIGLAAMQGLAMVTGRPVVGVSALDALAIDAVDRLRQPRARIGVWMDAARGEVFAAAYEVDRDGRDGPALVTLDGPDVDRPDAVWRRWLALRSASWCVTGDGAVRYAAQLGDAVRVAPGPLAPAIGRLARRHLGAGGHAPHDLQPLYVRRPDAERSRQP